jgi:hypothetical protein
MDFRGSQGRPQRPAPTRQQQTAPQVQASAPAANYREGSRKRWLLPVVVAVVVLLVLGAVAWHMAKDNGGAPRGDRYQAVFLDNGQVFFGKLKNTHGDYLTLESAYYTRKQDVPDDATEEQKAAVNNNVSLARVGDEVYGPESTLRIKAEQVLFWQDLKSDSKVAKAIDDAK